MNGMRRAFETKPGTSFDVVTTGQSDHEFKYKFTREKFADLYHRQWQMTEPSQGYVRTSAELKSAQPMSDRHESIKLNKGYG